MTEYMKNYYLNNKDKIIESNSKYKKENKDKIKETNKLYRLKYNKLNILCPSCKILILKSSLNRHNKRKHFI